MFNKIFKHNFLMSSFFFLIILYFLFCKEGVTGAEESLQTKHWTYSTAGWADKAASGSQCWYTKNTERPRRCSHSWNNIISKSTLFCFTVTGFILIFVCTISMDRVNKALYSVPPFSFPDLYSYQNMTGKVTVYLILHLSVYGPILTLNCWAWKIKM